jgi:tRNA 5-methylaminomethyl-2-thiouridine biosynthesis bifunctional protein
LPADHLRYLEAAEAAAAAGIALNQPALHLPQAGLARPKALALQATTKVEVRRRSEIAALRQGDGGWTLLDPSGAAVDRAEVVVLAAALATARLASLPFAFQARAGEITFLPPFAGIADLRAVLMFNGYLTPAVDVDGAQAHVLGATFDVVSPDNPVSLKGDAAARNLRALGKALPNLMLPDPAALNGRANVRATTTDHLAILGGAPDMDHYVTAYEGLRQGKRGPYPAARYRPGLYVLTGLGARGFLTAPLLAEALAAQVTGLPSPVERAALDAFHPARFWVREIKRG